MWYEPCSSLSVDSITLLTRFFICGRQSNSPFELLPVLSEFINVVGYPRGSLKLKFYGGKSLFKGLWEPAGERKRAGVVEVDHFRPFMPSSCR